jgi:hypothetical protein
LLKIIKDYVENEGKNPEYIERWWQGVLGNPKT